MSDLLLGRSDLYLERRAFFLGAGFALAPAFLEQQHEGVEHFLGRNDGTKQRLISFFDFRPGNGLAPHLAAAMTTEVVRVFTVESLGPVGRQGTAATPAHHIPTKWEILTDIGPRWRISAKSSGMSGHTKLTQKLKPPANPGRLTTQLPVYLLEPT